MQTPGERMKWTRLIQSDKYVVAVEVEVVIPIDDPSDPCYEPETILLLDQIQERADDGDVNWLLQHGTVYEAIGATDKRPERPRYFARKPSRGVHAARTHVLGRPLSGKHGLLTHAEKKHGIKVRATKNRV